MCGNSFLKKKNSTHLGQLRKSTGEFQFGLSSQGTPKLTIKKLRPARFHSTSRSVFYQTKVYSLMVLLIQL